MTPTSIRAAAFLALSTLLSCSGSPARFADRDPVTKVDDALPIPVPLAVDLVKPLYYSDVYVRLTLSEALDPGAPKAALDVNALDEVVESSWFAAGRDPGRDGEYRRDGRPQRPMTIQPGPAPSGTEDVVGVADARGFSYELLRDRPDAPEMRTASAVIASRLMFAIGYRTPEVWIDRDAAGRRVAATRWPSGTARGVMTSGLDLGPTLISALRFDDPFDTIPHEDRRSLRALWLAMAWLDNDRVRPGMLRDVYVGPAGLGHVQHQIVWLAESLGVGAFESRADAQDPKQVGGSVLRNLVMLGFAPRPTRDPTVAYPSVGIFSGHLDPASYEVRPPFAPFYEIQAPDLYWMSKRIAAIPRRVIADAVAAAELSDPRAADFLEDALAQRQQMVARFGAGLTTPCELVSADEWVRARQADGSLHLQIVEVLGPHLPEAERAASYVVEWLDAEGDELAEEGLSRPRGGTLGVVVPKALLDASPYVILRLTAIRGERRARRPCEVHLRPGATGVRIAGLRH